MIEPFNLPGCEFLDTFEFRFAAVTVITTVMMWLVARIRDRLLRTSSPGPEFVSGLTTSSVNLVATKAPNPPTGGSAVLDVPAPTKQPELSQEAKDWVLLLEDPCRPWRLEKHTSSIILDDKFRARVEWNASYEAGFFAVLEVKNPEAGFEDVTKLFGREERRRIGDAITARYKALKHFEDQNERRRLLGVEKEVMAQAFSFRGRGV